MVWSFFSKEVDDVAECRICHKGLVIAGGSSGNLVRHLRLKHPTDIEGMGWKSAEIPKLKGRIRSDAWSYFIKDDNWVECVLCQTRLAVQEGTNNMLRHLKSKHPEACKDKRWKIKPVYRYPVLPHFELMENQQMAICKLCKAIVTYNGSETLLAKHIKKKHKALTKPALNEITEEKNQQDNAGKFD